MYIIAAVTILLYLVLWLLSRREEISCKSRLMRPFYRMAAFCCRFWKGRDQESLYANRIYADLKKLYPNEPGKWLMQHYMIEKLGLILAVILTGTLFGTAAAWQVRQGAVLRDGNIMRGDYAEEKKLILEAQIEGQKMKQLELTVRGRLLTKQEADGLEEEFWELLSNAALGNNPSWEEISSDLDLADGAAGYPFTVEWESNSPFLVDDYGSVRKQEDRQQAELKATVMYEQWEWVHRLPLTIVPEPLSDEERQRQELTGLLTELENTARAEEQLQLPGKWQGSEISWKEQLEDYGILLWGLAATAAAGIFFLKDQDLHTQVTNREKLLKASYPLIVNKLALYIGAGLTTRGAFGRIARDYEDYLAAGEESQPAYEELLHTCRELKTGVAEAVAYEHFGKRCGVQEYIRLGALLTQNLKKGNSELLNRLREEADTALRERLNRSRQIGEEASTRLLLPMMMMLGVVMVMIMLPAFGIF